MDETFFCNTENYLSSFECGGKSKEMKKREKRERTCYLDLWAICCRVEIHNVDSQNYSYLGQCVIYCVYMHKLRNDRNTVMTVILSYDQGLHRIYLSGYISLVLYSLALVHFSFLLPKCRRHVHRCDIRKRVIERKRERERLNKSTGEMRYEKF